MKTFEFKSKFGMCFCGPPIGIAVTHETRYGNWTEIKKHIPRKCECCGKLWSEHDGISKDQLEEMKKFYL